MLTAWDPVRLLDRMVDDVMNGSFGTATNAKSFVPQVDVRSRQFEAGGSKEQLLLGRSYGTFTRSFSLPDHLDDEKLAAKLVDGVLTIEIPRLQKAKPRRIEINGNGARAISEGDKK